MRVLFIFILVLAQLAMLNSCKRTATVSPESNRNYYMDGKTVFLKAADLTAAIEFAAAKNKPLFVEFVADWCLPCKIMSDEVFTHPETAQFLNDNFVNYKLDVEEGSGPNMKMLYMVDILPTLLFVDHNGRTLARNDGSLMHNGLKSIADEALSQWDAGL